jgi:hypothetical protein
LCASLFVFTQPVGPQATTIGGLQDVPHFEAAASTQMPPQNTCPGLHEHFAALQTSPAAHPLPHAPQCLALDIVSMHAPLHATRPVGHDATHARALQ